MTVTVDVNLNRVADAINRLIALGGRPGPLLNDIGELLFDRTLERFDLEIDPDGRPWAPLSPDYLASNKKKRSRFPNNILRRSGGLRQTINFRIEGDSVIVGAGADQGIVGEALANDPARRSGPFFYAATHQFGRGAIPARPYLGFSDDDDRSVETLIVGHIQRLITGGSGATA